MTRRINSSLLPWLGLVFVVLLTALIYWPGTQGSFLLDDFPNIVDNPAMRSVALTPADMWRVAESTQTGPLGRPIAMMSFAVNAHFTGLNPQAMKLTNLVIHLLNGVLVFLLLRLLLGEYARLRGTSPSAPPFPVKEEAENELVGAPHGRDPEPDASATGRAHGALLQQNISSNRYAWLALAVTAAWLLAPINLTAVLYVVQRMTSLAALFTLAALIVFVIGRRWLYAHRRRIGAIVLLLVAALVLVPLAALSKETGVLTLAYALVIEWVFFRFRNSASPVGAPHGRDPELHANSGGRAHGALLQEPERKSTPLSWTTIAYFVVFLLLPLILGLLWLFPGVLAPGAWSVRGFTAGERVLTEGRVLWHYLYWTLVPDISSMSLYHDAFPLSRSLFSPWTSLLAWAGIGALLAAGLLCRKRWPLVSFGLLWFLIGQTLTASFISLELVYEHRQYLPALGLLLIVFAFALLLRARPGLQRLLAGAAVVLVLLYAGALTLRSLNWSNPLVQAAIAAKTHPDSPRATYAYARLLLGLSKAHPLLIPKAKQAIEAARQVPGQGILPTSSLILLAQRMHAPMQSDWFASMAKKLAARPPNPGDISALEVLVRCATREHNPCRLPAIAMTGVFQAALNHKSVNGYVMAIYANYLLNVLHQPRAAARIFRVLIQRAPDNARYHFSLGVCLAIAGDGVGARAELAMLRRLNRYGAFDHSLRQLTDLIQRLYPEPKQP